MTLPQTAVAPATPQNTTIIRPTRGIAALQLDAFWHYRELLYFLVWRDVKVRYKQTALGVLWVLLQPLLTTFVFTLLFGMLLQVPSGDVPYPVFALAGLLPWQYLATSLTRSSVNLVESSSLITKVYFPRMIIPASGALSGLVDFAVGLVIMFGLMVFYRITPTPAVVLLPGFVLLAIATALGTGLWLSALNVRFRDVKHLVPFLVQIWMYLTPVIYPVTIIPEPLRPLLALNPMTGVVEGFRWALLGQQPPSGLIFVSMAITLVVLVSGAYYFRSTERTFADII